LVPPLLPPALLLPPLPALPPVESALSSKLLS
jgi:hypothetical protein